MAQYEELSTLTVSEFVKVLTNSYTQMVKSKRPFKEFPATMLWGQPGVGKSQGVYEIAEALKATTHKSVQVCEVRLLLFNPIDLRGIPVANEDKTLAVWLKPKIFQMDESSQTINILFLDEISSAPASVQAAAYQLVLDRAVGEHKLPDNCLIIAAGNRTTDKSVAYKMPKALANRFLHINVESNFKDWKAWAITHGINSKIIGFLNFCPKLLNTFDDSDQIAFATPRTWEMASHILDNSDSLNEAFPLICGLVGSGAAYEFNTWCKVYKDLPDYQDIRKGKEHKVPTNASTLYALSAMMVENMHKDKTDSLALSYAIDYVNLLPPDYSTMIFKDLMLFEEEFKEVLMQNPAFSNWLRTKGRLLNGQ